jgi:hypothetical protein
MKTTNVFNSSFLTIAIFSSIMVLCGFVFAYDIYAQELPFGVAPKEVVESGTLDIGESQMLGFDKNGNLTMSYEYKVGNRIGVKVEEVAYELRFWNVGKLGGTSGYLFWKKDFGKATLTITPIASTPGSLITDTVDNSKFNMPDGYKMEEVGDTPDPTPTSCTMTFSGGPQGTFDGVCDKGEKIIGNVVAGSGVTFAITLNENEMIPLQWVNRQEIRFAGIPFSDWKFDETQLEDSGARFSSLMGEVEVRHEKDTTWMFAKLNIPLYVLDHVKTGDESQAIVGFSDLSTFLLKADSEIVITTPLKKDSKLKLVGGNIMANVKKLLKDGTMEIEMSQAVAGIKGTRFVLTETGSESKIEVAEGVVEFRSKVDNSIAMVGSGETVTATAVGLGEKTIFDPAILDNEIITATDVAQLPVNTSTVDQTSTGASDKIPNTKKTDHNMNYAILIPILVAIIVGVWVVKKKRG